MSNKSGRTRGKNAPVSNPAEVQKTTFPPDLKTIPPDEIKFEMPLVFDEKMIASVTVSNWTAGFPDNLPDRIKADIANAKLVFEQAEEKANRFKIITYTEAGEQVGKCRQTIANWANDGLIPIVRHPSGVPGIRQSDFDKLYGAAVAAHKANSEPDQKEFSEAG